MAGRELAYYRSNASVTLPPRTAGEVGVIHGSTRHTILSGVRLSPFGTAAIISLLYQPQMIDEVIMEQLM